jgi:hypothetical protein
MKLLRGRKRKWGDTPGRVQVDTEHNANAPQKGSTGSKRQAIYSEFLFFKKRSRKFFFVLSDLPPRVGSSTILGVQAGQAWYQDRNTWMRKVDGIDGEVTGRQEERRHLVASKRKYGKMGGI